MRLAEMMPLAGTALRGRWPNGAIMKAFERMCIHIKNLKKREIQTST